MAVLSCYICNEDPVIKRRYGRQGLADGAYCPICQHPACRYHLSVVRWRWRSSREIDSALICKKCQRSYAHRHWDVFNRDWIS